MLLIASCSFIFLFGDTQTIITHHHHPKASFKPPRQRSSAVITGSDHACDINCSLVYLHHPSCLCVGLQEAELQVGLWLPVLALSVEEEGRGGGGCSYIAL